MLRLTTDNKFCNSSKNFYFCRGELAEWSNAAVLKTVNCHRFGGSNPSLSAKKAFRKRKAFCISIDSNQKRCPPELKPSQYNIACTFDGFQQLPDYK